MFQWVFCTCEKLAQLKKCKCQVDHGWQSLMYQSKHCLPQSQWHLRVYWRSFFGLAQASNMRRRGKQGSSHSVVCLFSASRVQSYPGSAIHIACLQHAKKECCCFTRINTRSEHETRQHAPFSGKPKQEFPENMWNLTGRALAHHLKSGISVASSSFTLFCSIKTSCWTHGTGWEEMEAIGFLMLLGTSFWTMERATSPSSCSIACMLVTHSRLPTVYPTKQLSLKSMNWTGRTIAPPLPAFQTSPHRPPAMHEAQQNLGTLDKPHNITFLTVAWLYPLLAVSSTMVYSSLCYSTPLHPSLLFSALLYSSLLFSPFLSCKLIVLFSPLRSSPLLYSSLPYSCPLLPVPTLSSPLYSCLSPSLSLSISLSLSLPCSSLIFSAHLFPSLLLSVLLF